MGILGQGDSQRARRGAAEFAVDLGQFERTGGGGERRILPLHGARAYLSAAASVKTGFR